MTETTTEYSVRYQHDGNANVEGACYDTLSEARETFDAECSTTDSKGKTVQLVEVACEYDGDECVDVSDVRVIETATV